jgi:hypothetical protein
MSTQNFSLEQFGPSGRISDNNYKFSDRDRATIDSLLWTLIQHDHRDTSTDSVMTGPTQRPDITLSTTGGTIPAGQSMYYKIAYVDANGNETEASITAETATTDALVSPPIMPLSYATTGGSLDPGVYRYALAYYQSGIGVTTATNVATINVPVGTNTNVITITLDTLPPTATGWRIYRKGPGDYDYFWLDTVTSGPDYDDDGLDLAIDCTKTRPGSNTTNSTNSITLDIEATDLPLDDRITSWRIYRTNTVGFFGPTSLLATVVDTTTQAGSDLVTTYLDVGAVTFAGSPLSETVVPPPVPQLDVNDVFAGDTRLQAKHAPQGIHSHNTSANGTIAAQDYNQFYVVEDMPVERIDVFYQNAPTGVDGSNYLTMRVSDDASGNAVQSIYTSSEVLNEIQHVYNNATGGTFTLSDGTDTTTAIDWDATAGTVETRLETDITAITDVSVVGSGNPSDAWVVTWVDPGSADVTYTLIAGDGSLTGGTSTVSVGQNGSDGGTFTLSDGTDTTSAIDFDAAAATVETRLETDITSITAVTVTGTGTDVDPWLVEFVTPGSQEVSNLIPDDANLNGTAYVSTITEGFGVTELDVVFDSAGAYKFWQSSTTDAGEIEAEDATGDGTDVSDALATNDVAVILNSQTETQEWDFGTGLDAGDYRSIFYVALDSGAEATLRVVDQFGGDTTIASMVISDGSTYLPPKVLSFTDTGSTEDWRFEVEKTDAGAGEVRVDKFEYELRHPLLHAGATATVEFLVTNSPSTNGDDAQITVWY